MRKICWVAWDDVCKDRECGGLEIKSLGDFNLTLLGKVSGSGAGEWK